MQDRAGGVVVIVDITRLRGQILRLLHYELVLGEEIHILPTGIRLIHGRLQDGHPALHPFHRLKGNIILTGT